MCEVEQIVATVRTSRKYRSVCTDTIRRIARDEWARRGALRPAIKATKTRLHQLYGAYEIGIDYRLALDALQMAHAAGSGRHIRNACRELLAHHASTRERMSILDRFYSDLFIVTGIPRSLLDLACGLNPLSIPWMGLQDGAMYHAYDIDGERINFMNDCPALAGVQVRAHQQDVICNPPREKADLALLFKSSTCLERQQRGSTLGLLDTLEVDWVLVSFPVKSLGRREKGMPAHYAQAFVEMLAGRTWNVTQMGFATELVFIVDKR